MEFKFCFSFDKLRALIGVITLALGALVFTSCGLAKDVGECPLLSPDQRGSFMGKAKSTPLNVIVDSGLTGTGKNQIHKAVNQWNSQGNRFQAGNFFSVSIQSIPAGIRSADPRDCSQSYGSESTLYLVNENSDSRWKSLGLSGNNPGATIRCGTTSEVHQQIIYINDRLMPGNQLMSVVLHEFGHSLGLDHSCADGAGSSNYKSCSGLNSDHPYKQAIMYPILSASEFKEILMPNDNTRTQCYYGVF